MNIVTTKNDLSKKSKKELHGIYIILLFITMIGADKVILPEETGANQMAGLAIDYYEVK